MKYLKSYAQTLYDTFMSNAKEFQPEAGAFTSAAKKLGITPQAVSQAWKRGRPMRVMAAVVIASKEIRCRQERERRQYSEIIRKAAQLADEVNGLIE